MVRDYTSLLALFLHKRNLPIESYKSEESESVTNVAWPSLVAG
jgi:hypothetical protein